MKITVIFNGKEYEIDEKDLEEFLKERGISLQDIEIIPEGYGPFWV